MLVQMCSVEATAIRHNDRHSTVRIRQLVPHVCSLLYSYYQYFYMCLLSVVVLALTSLWDLNIVIGSNVMLLLLWQSITSIQFSC